ncbi:MAG TPA: PAS domain S-box protein [Candidatus Saccharimonadales bacterium]|nr:PAS domain S-box protein [Candidatus Saccharimonadales bacterium]
MGTDGSARPAASQIRVSGVDVGWDVERGICTLQDLPVVMLRTGYVLPGLMSAMHAMVGTERFRLALQSEGRKSVEADWQIISGFPDFHQGFQAFAEFAAVAGWGRVTLVSMDEARQECRFRVTDSWESAYQKELGVCWGSGMLAGKLAGYCTRLFGTNCWAEQTAFIARGDACDEFVVGPSLRSVEEELEAALGTELASPAAVAVAQDRLERAVGERERVEEALRESEALFRSQFELGNIGIAITSPDKGWLRVNRRLCEMFGYTEAELRQLTWAQMTHREDLAADVALFNRVLAGEIEAYELDKRFLRKDGSIIATHLTVSCFRNQDRSVRFFIASFQDVTESQNAQKERLELERRLLHAQKLESLGVLAGGIAHDFNNLLMAIVGNLDLALLRMPGVSKAHQPIERAIQATHRAGDLTRQMLAYSGKGRFAVSRFDLSDLVRENAELFRTAIARTVTLELSLASEPATVEADPGQVQQVIMNLITNASEALADQAGRITLRTGVLPCDEEFLRRSRLEERPEPGRFAYIEVADTGCGMNEETQQRFFDPFFTTKFTGRGLGMSAVLGIVRGHQGAILVESAEGRGTTIRVLFPESEATARPPALEPVPAVPAPGKGRGSRAILVVDDEEAVRSICLDFVEHLGYRGLGAADGTEALSVFEREAGDIACVLLDLTMPRMDGLSAFRELKRRRPEVRVILSSGYTEQDAMQRFAGEGLAGFIQKPYRLQDLRDRILHVL